MKDSAEGFCDGDNQQRASTSRGNLKLAIAKRCRSNKLVRQRFAFALRFSRWFDFSRWIQWNGISRSAKTRIQQMMLTIRDKKLVSEQVAPWLTAIAFGLVMDTVEWNQQKRKDKDPTDDVDQQDQALNTRPKAIAVSQDATLFPYNVVAQSVPIMCLGLGSHMANQIKWHNVSSLTHENFPGGHPSQYCSHSSGSKPRPVEKPGKPENTYRQENTSPRGTSGSNPSTESNTNSIRKATDKYANAMQGIKATTKSREPKDRNNSSTARSDQRENIQCPRGRCLRTPQQLQENVRRQYSNEASQQEESNATTLTSIGAVYRRQSKKIRSLTQLTLTQLTAEFYSLTQNAVVPTNPNDDVEEPATKTR
ncbi:hypothetical protein F511_38747 [Dorcoceras hygrometricum]|uniref:Uncharacterized protein n=1 Tax=Dorcoceras hygrometricum TaxID=472368 RepID=A0A2Z7D4J9_9LAMI|nr:hypothetical protein F511_38747 [Dorcoceras hygrometricum]